MHSARRYSRPAPLRGTLTTPPQENLILSLCIFYNHSFYHCHLLFNPANCWVPDTEEESFPLSTHVLLAVRLQRVYIHTYQAPPALNPGAGQKLLPNMIGKQATHPAAEDKEFTMSHRSPTRTLVWHTHWGSHPGTLHARPWREHCCSEGKLGKQPTPAAREYFPTSLGETNSYMAWGLV